MTVETRSIYSGPIRRALDGSSLLLKSLTDRVTPTAWSDVTFQNGWSNFGGAYQTCQYRKVGDIVEMRGVAKGGASGTVGFTLPAGFRPLLAMDIATLGNGVSAYVEPWPNGEVRFHGQPNFWINSQFSVTP